MYSQNPDEHKVQLAEITNNTPVKKRVKELDEIEKCEFADSSDCVSLDLEKENVCFRYKTQNNFPSQSDSEENKESDYFTEKDILKLLK
ncbi:hypothetical protein EHP00_862 [Ecytonucleospora hepatopenaei]|uniref:Uncharacterized protein n=1 Tax=Ecytonucleospora hepatopenaei TaxID=646526 RepID=A0A1W0E4U3_9MICR|nr:hypothetical protein EHP00_862 [Ecytonucleospora hepatopenaei]